MPALLACLLLTIPLVQGPSQPPVAPEAERGSATWTWTAFTAENGLPQNSVSSVVQTRDGYIWIGTQAGLTRFDGLRFRVYDLSSDPPLGSIRVAGLAEDAQGNLWGVTTGGGFRFARGLYSSLVELPETPTGRPRSLETGADGSVWIGADDVLRFDGTRGQRIDTGLDSIKRSVHLTRNGDAWIAAAEGISHVPRGAEKGLLVDVPRGGSHFVGETPDGVLWTAGIDWVALFDGSRFVEATAGDPAPGRIQAALVDSSGVYWVGSSGGLFQCQSVLDADGAPVGLSFAPAATGYVTPGRGVRSLMEDREGNLWVGTHVDGLLRGRRRPFASVPLPQAGQSRWPVLVTPPGASCSWLALRDGLRRFEGGEWKLVPELEEIHPVDALLAGRDGGLWIAERPGVLIHFADGSFRRHEHDLRRISRLHEGRDGRLWIATAAGISVLDGDRLSPPFCDPAWPSPLPSPPPFHETDRGAVWVATNGLLMRCDDPGTRHPLPDVEIRSVHDDGGDLWLATYGAGLLRVRDGVVASVTRDSGLPSNSLGKILGDGRGNLWINSNRGVIRVALDELNGVADGTSTLLHAHVEPTGEGNGEAGGHLPDGRMWFPTVNRIVVVDPDVDADNRVPPQVRVERLEVNGEEVALDEPVVVPPGDSRLSFEYTAMSFVDPGRVRFKYRLEGADTDWIDVGAARSVHFSGLAPGRYRFQVAARNEDGLWSQSDASLALEIAPHVYQTEWFRASAAALAVLGVFLLITLRTRRLRSRNEELQNENLTRQRVEATLRAGEERLRVALSAAEMGTWRFDPATELYHRDSNLNQMLGLRAVDTESDTLFPQVHPDDLVAMREEFDRARAENRGFSREFRILREDGTIRWLSDQGRPYCDPTGDVAYLTGAAVDVTDRKLAEELHGEVEARLRHTQKMEAIGRLASGVAHEFNNLLVVILGNVDLALCDTEDLSPSLRQALEDVQRCADRASALTRQLLTFAKKEHRRPTPFDVNDVIRDSRAMLLRFIGDRGDLMLDLTPEPLVVEADRGEVQQALVNLALNAADAMAAPGSVTVHTRRVGLDDAYVSRTPGARPGPHVRLTVRDTGCGMSTETLERVFEPFFTTKPQGKGTGLGLSTVFSDVARAGGHIGVDSTLGEGTSFHVYLPLTASSTSIRSSAAEPTLPGGNETILIFDDERLVATTLATMLEGAGYSVRCATRHSEAIEQTSPSRPPVDLLLTDVVMPKIRGTAFARDLMLRQPGLRVILMSGYAPAQAFHGDPLIDDAEFLQKPVARDELLRRVRAVLDAPPPSSATLQTAEHPGQAD